MSNSNLSAGEVAAIVTAGTAVILAVAALLNYILTQHRKYVRMQGEMAMMQDDITKIKQTLSTVDEIKNKINTMETRSLLRAGEQRRLQNDLNRIMRHMGIE